MGFPPFLYSKTGWLKCSIVQKHQVSKLKTTLESHRTKSDKLTLTLKKSLFIENKLDSAAWRLWLSSSENIFNFKKPFEDVRLCWVCFYIKKHATIYIILPWKFEMWCRSLNLTPFCNLKRYFCQVRFVFSECHLSLLFKVTLMWLIEVKNVFLIIDHDVLDRLRYVWDIFNNVGL